MSTNPQPDGVLSFQKAYDCVQRYCRSLKPSGKEMVALADSPGRVLAELVTADRDFPPFPRATRDGYALRAGDTKGVPAKLRIVGQIKAGSSYSKQLGPEEAVEIMTGAPVPEGADAVVMVEHTRRDGDTVELQRTVASGENIVPRAAEAHAGQPMLQPGTRISFPQVAVAAAVGKTHLQVYKKPRVAILSTGDEVVEVSATPSPDQIRNSNSYSLAAQVKLAGGEPLRLAIAPDDRDATRKSIEEGLTADLLLLSGGVSMGKFDFVEQALTDLQARFFFTGALIQPGRPVIFGQAPHARSLRTVPFFGLPGNPISTMVTFDLFARPVVYALGGQLPVRLPTAEARLGSEIRTRTGLTRFLPAILEGGPGDARVSVIPWHGSGDLQAIARANCYVIVPPDRESISAGERVGILLHS